MRSISSRKKIRELAKKYDCTIEEIEAVVKSPLEFMRETCRDLDLPGDLTREEFDKLKTNFNIPCIGKLYASFYMYCEINRINGKR